MLCLLLPSQLICSQTDFSLARSKDVVKLPSPAVITPSYGLLSEQVYVLLPLDVVKQQLVEETLDVTVIGCQSAAGFCAVPDGVREPTTGCSSTLTTSTEDMRVTAHVLHTERAARHQTPWS